MSGEASKPKCQFYLAHKKRNCKFDAVSGKSFCGNHLFAATGAGTRRIPCTIDPTQCATFIADWHRDMTFPECRVGAVHVVISTYTYMQ